jgi:hypothetical protein
MDLARTLDFLKDLSFLRDVDVSGTTAKHRAPNTSHEPGARAGAFLKDATRTHDEWTRAMGEADAALRRARLLRSKIAAAVDLIEATEKIDPSGDPTRYREGESRRRARAHRSSRGGQARGFRSRDRGVHQAQARGRVASAAAEQELGRRRAAHLVRRGEGARARVVGDDGVCGRVR